MFPDLPQRAEHGGLVKRYQEETGRTVIDFSASLNPFPPCIKPDFPPGLLDHYPDDAYARLREAIGTLFHREPAEIAVGNGSIEIIRTFCQLIFRKGGSALIETPTFGEYLLSTQLGGGHQAAGDETPDVHFICNPNNPDGALRKKHEITGILEELSQKGRYLFLDEAFIELADPAESLSDIRSPNLLVLRSLTKCFSVPGIRFGYAFGDSDLVSALETIRPPWSVNAIAEQFALEAFSHYRELEVSRRKIQVERDMLSKALADSGLQVMPSSANFILVHTGMAAGELCRRLLMKDILVRDCASFGLPESIRVAVRNRNDNKRLIEAVSECLH